MVFFFDNLFKQIQVNMKKIVAAALIIVLASCAKENAPLANSQYANVLQMQKSDAKNWFINQSSKVQAEFWVFKIQEELLLDWNSNQIKDLKNLIQIIKAGYFESSNHAELGDKWLLEAKNNFSDLQIYHLVGQMHLSSVSPTYELNKSQGMAPGGPGDYPLGECECNMKSDYCGFPISTGQSCKLSNQCFPTQSRGCGFLLSHPCKGYCTTS